MLAVVRENFGLVVIGIGLVFLASNLGYIPMTDVWRLWPVALIVISSPTVAVSSWGCMARFASQICQNSSASP